MPSRRAYALAGALLALGAPLGLVLLRSVTRVHAPSIGWTLAELARDPLVYVYMTTTTVVVFALFGYVLGRSADRLRHSAATDPLTLLPNRGSFDTALAREVSRATRYRQHLSLLILDIDDLKLRNDRSGHVAGDSALQGIGRALAGACRATDVPARIGGDEFALIAPGIGSKQALEIALRIRQLLELLGPRPVVRVSVGIADLDAASLATRGALFAAADAALYRAKSLGKDQIVLAEPFTHRPSPPPVNRQAPSIS
jgi:diguanylate cyclase (GGDEF)-like protein